jgi:hypothetical protein
VPVHWRRVIMFGAPTRRTLALIFQWLLHLAGAAKWEPVASRLRKPGNRIFRHSELR